MSVEGKVAIVTGAGAGIGRACAELFAERGARIVIAERDPESGAELERRLKDQGRDCLFVQTDVSDPDSMKNMVDGAIRAYGRIDILYNNAGGSSPKDGPVTTTPFDEFWDRMRIDLFGVWLGCHFAIPHMIEAGGGAVVNATSVLALRGTPSRSAYVTAKGGVIALTQTMAVDFAPHGIRVNAIAPGFTMTERVARRMADGSLQRSPTIARNLLGVCEPREVAQGVLFLASEEASKITGHVLPVDSGFTAT